MNPPPPPSSAPPRPTARTVRVARPAPTATLRALRALLDGPAPDTALAAAFVAVMAYERVTAGLSPTVLPAALALSAAVAGPLALRRRAPLAAYLTGSAALSVEALFVLPSPVSPYANLIGLYSLGLHATRRRAQVAPVIVLFGMAAYFTDLDGPGRYAEIPAGVLFLWLLAWAVGYGTARRQEERDAARRLLRRRVAAEERARLARELHDLVGHTVSLMLVQAGAARRLLDRDPDRTRELITGVEQTGREALDELDRILGLLRRTAPATAVDTADAADRTDGTDRADGTDGADRADESPSLQPGLADLPRLAERVRRTGLRVTVRIDPATPGLPRTVDVSAYRIVQEALTNTVRHARAEHAEVTVRRGGAGPGERLDIEVRDDGRGAAAGCVPGRGLLGIAERVSILGGRVEHGGAERGGFRVRAELPLT
ncbi:sensor histidine kinase [Kitasatospora sp. NPDC004240]